MAYILTICCDDAKGIVASVAGVLADLGGFIEESAQFGDPVTGRFFMRVMFTLDKEVDTFFGAFSDVSKQFSMAYQVKDVRSKTKALIAVSKHTHCLNDLMHRVGANHVPLDVVGIVSNHQDASAIADLYDVPFHYLPVTPKTKAAQEEAIYDLYNSSHAELLILARYMQILSPDLVEKVKGQAINIHHSFLPGFKGGHPYRQAYDRGVKLIGATAHYVTEDLDEGPIIEQEVLHVNHGHDVQQLQRIGHDIESMVLTRALTYHCEGRVLINGSKTVVFK